MLFGDRYVEESFWEALGKLTHARAFAHGGSNAYSPIVGVGHVAKPVAEHLRISWRRRRGGWRGRGRSDLAQCVHAEGIVLGFGVAFAFLCNNMQKLRPAQGFNVAQDLNQFFGVVSVDQTNVIKTNLLE